MMNQTHGVSRYKPLKRKFYDQITLSASQKILLNFSKIQRSRYSEEILKHELSIHYLKVQKLLAQNGIVCQSEFKQKNLISD